MRPGKRSGIKKDFYQRALKFEIALILFLLGCILLVASWAGKRRHVNEQRVRISTKIQRAFSLPDHNAQEVQTGFASYYEDEFDGRLTASGERYDKRQLTAAHREHPYGTAVRVTNLSNGKSVVVRVNDRGPYKKDRIIDVSGYAARVLGLVEAGIAKVRVNVVE